MNSAASASLRFRLQSLLELSNLLAKLLGQVFTEIIEEVIDQWYLGKPACLIDTEQLGQIADR